MKAMLFPSEDITELIKQAKACHLNFVQKYGGSIFGSPLFLYKI
jgi:hypothetical protein